MKNFIRKPYGLIVLLLATGFVLWIALYVLAYYAGTNQGKYSINKIQKVESWFATLFGATGISTNKITEDIVKVTESPVMAPKVTKKMSPSNKVTSKVTARDTTVSPIMSPSSSPIRLVTPTQTPPATPKKITTPSLTPFLTPFPSITPTPLPTFTPLPTPSLTPSPSLPLITITQTLSPSPIVESSSVAVAINEIAWMGTATSSADEWMELYNATGNPIDLSGWTLKSLTGSNPDPIIVLSGIIQPFGYFLLERTNDTTISDISADQIYTGALSDSGEILELRDASGNLHDRVSNTGGWYVGNKIGRFSMERIDSKQTGDNASNWKTNDGITKNGHDAGNSPISGTPKAINSAN